MTTRKLAATVTFAVGLAGCATPGPLHIYSVAAPGSSIIRDDGPDQTADAPSFLASDETLTGFAYDPFTDHFFLRLAPGNRIRVVDRPARAIKREFDIPIDGAGDLAVRPRDGHMFLLGAETGRVTETTRLGQLVRTLPLGEAILAGIAFDSARDHILTLDANGRSVRTHDLEGKLRSQVTLEQPASNGLAFDAEKRELYAPLRGRAGEIGIFAETGRFLRVAPTRGEFVDVGPRSFIRVF